MSDEEGRVTEPVWLYPTIRSLKVHWFPKWGERSGCGKYMLRMMELTSPEVENSERCAKCEHVSNYRTGVRK